MPASRFFLSPNLNPPLLTFLGGLGLLVIRSTDVDVVVEVVDVETESFS